MNKILAAIGLTVALICATPAAAQADEWGPWNIADAGDVCVRADFAARGSGWPVAKAVANWNAVQTDVRFRVGYDASCSDVLVHRYSDPDDGLCGRTDFVRLWDLARAEAGVVIFAGADVYLNDACSPTRLTRKWVLAHELGHAIGLTHSAAADSVMSPTYDAGLYRGMPGPYDVATLDALYL